jgi:ABC-2 type transport system permease protein
MRAEFLKIRSMPTPFWTGVAMLVCFLGGIAATITWGIGADNAVLDIAIGVPTMIGSLILGSWVAGVEFGQNTLRRVLSTDPRRTRLVLVKLATVLIIVVLVTTVLMIAGFLVYSLTGSGHAAEMDSGFAVRILCASLITNVTYAVTALSLTLLSRSMAGGMTITFVFFFVLDGLLSLIPKVGDYMIGVAQTDIDLAIRQQSEGIFETTATNETSIAVVVLVGWLIAFTVAGIVRTVRTEVK